MNKERLFTMTHPARSGSTQSPSMDAPHTANRSLSKLELSALESAILKLGGHALSSTPTTQRFQFQEHRIECRGAAAEGIRWVVVAIPLFPAEREHGSEAILALLGHMRSIHQRSALGLSVAINPSSHLVELLLPVMSSELNADLLHEALLHLTEQTQAILQALE